MPNTHLSRELDHALGASMLGEAMLQWRPVNRVQQRNLAEELLAHSRAAANILTGILEHRAVMTDERGSNDLVDPWDLYGLSDLLATLLEVPTIVERRDCD